eukprot:CFRG5574T1
MAEGDVSVDTYESLDGPRVIRIVLTGGPCAGKTTCLARLSTFLLERGISVFTVPEAATMCWTNGAVQFDETTTETQMLNFQATLMQLQMSLEDTFYKIAKNGTKPAVLLCDRGLMDGSAYISNDLWDGVLKQFGYNNVMLRDQRYDLIFFLVTAADGAEANYKTNTISRTEDLKAARLLDGKLQKSWIGHPHLHIFDNSTDFEGKMRRIINAASLVLGLPTTKRKARKYLLKSIPDWSTIHCKYEMFDVTKVYLRGSKMREGDGNNLQVDTPQNSANEATSDKDFVPSERILYSFVRRRTAGTMSSHNQTTMVEVTEMIDGEIKTRTFERKTIISQRTYAQALNMADPKRNQVIQKRVSFLWEGAYLTVVEYMNVKPGLCVLRVQESKDDDGDFSIPDFLDVDREVGKEPQYSSYTLSILGHKQK